MFPAVTEGLKYINWLFSLQFICLCILPIFPIDSLIIFYEVLYGLDITCVFIHVCIYIWCVHVSVGMYTCLCVNMRMCIWVCVCFQFSLFSFKINYELFIKGISLFLVFTCYEVS